MTKYTGTFLHTLIKCIIYNIFLLIIVYYTFDYLAVIRTFAFISGITITLGICSIYIHLRIKKYAIKENISYDEVQNKLKEIIGDFVPEAKYMFFTLIIVLLLWIVYIYTYII